MVGAAASDGSGASRADTGDAGGGAGAPANGRVPRPSRTPSASVARDGRDRAGMASGCRLRPHLRRTGWQIRPGRCCPPGHGGRGRGHSPIGWCAGPAGMAGQAGLGHGMRAGTGRSRDRRVGSCGGAGRRHRPDRRVGRVRPQRLGCDAPRPGRKSRCAGAPGSSPSGEQDAGGGTALGLPRRGSPGRPSSGCPPDAASDALIPPPDRNGSDRSAPARPPARPGPSATNFRPRWPGRPVHNSV